MKRSITEQFIRLEDDSAYGTLYQPKDQRGLAGVVLVGGSNGGEPSLAAKLLAMEGFAALSVAYFGRPGLPPHLQNIPLEYFRAAGRYLSDTAKLPPGRVAILGISRGSEAAFLSAVHFSDLFRAVIAIVPGNLVLCGWPPGQPAWLLGGTPLPYVSHFGPYTEKPEAAIAVERIQGPILVASAGADQVWPSAAMARAICDRLSSCGHRAGHLLLNYPDATHSLGFLVPGPLEGYTPPGLPDWPRDQEARADAWPKIIAFLRRFGTEDLGPA